MRSVKGSVFWQCPQVGLDPDAQAHWPDALHGHLVCWAIGCQGSGFRGGDLCGEPAASRTWGACTWLASNTCSHALAGHLIGCGGEVPAKKLGHSKGFLDLDVNSSSLRPRRILFAALMLHLDDDSLLP